MTKSKLVIFRLYFLVNHQTTTPNDILYILGNGFDKAQKMATGYPDFYKYLTDKVKDESALLGKMKSAITENTELWARSGILAKLKEFGADVASNIVANILTNPMIWGGL